MVQLTITHSDGSTETIAETVGWTRKREIGHMRRAVIDVERSLASGVTLEPKDDKVALGSIDTLRLVDVEKGGPKWSLICYSFEWDANTVEPTSGGDLRTGTDQNLVNALVGEVSGWSAGTVENHTGTLTFVFNHAHRHEALRRIEKNVPGEIQFRDEGTVDYLENLGTDKSASVTLSAANGNIEGEIQITNRGRELDGTHIRVLGAHEGEAQLFANLVPSADGNSYDNRVNYSTSRWSSGDTRDWDRWQNKDVTDQATIDEEAAAIGEEITEDLVEAKATVVGEDLSVGDWVHVKKPDAGLDRDMRVHRIKTVVRGAKQVDELLLSTRTTVRKGDSQELEDIQRFNTAFQGSSVIVQGGGSRQPVNASLNAELPFRYPQINFEHTAELFVRGLPYRAYSSGAAGGGDHTHDVEIEAPPHQHELSNPGADASFGKTETEDSSTFTDHQHVFKVDESLVSFSTTTKTSDASGTHTHNPDPGITEFATRTPSGVDVIIGGSTVATNIGSGTFQTTVDISDQLTQGSWNLIELTSDALGHIQATVFIRAYDQIGTQ